MGMRAFQAPGRFWRGNLHTHSNRSDGGLPPEAVCAHYRDAGYDFLCLSDHFLSRFDFPVTDTRPFRRGGFTTLLGAELHADATSHGELWHILAAGLPEDFEPTGKDEDGLALAKRAREAGAFLGIAHPQWSGLTIEDGRAMAAHAHSVEIYNYTCDLETARADGTYLLDELLNEGYALSAYAADDTHFKYEEGLAAWVMVKAAENTPEALLEALKDGLFYSSQGPVIEGFSIADGEVAVECSPAVNVALVGRGAKSENQWGRDLTRVRLSSERFEGDWFRLIVADAAGRLAWSNPVRFD
ncbi:CehA/McbA family metallohydrolase [Afifella aestuarii]|uniref:CehA/McbA family metallohydrolase n=1 Tax=Afifella aestuarii TaxID=1909496 RepID=UPI000FE33225|nr:CehA/McbA family metallohydrolase [Afifella aestuarii]